MALKNETGFAKFVMHKVPNAQFFFNSYAVEGNQVYLKTGTNRNGEDIKAFIKWPKGKRIITLPIGKTDNNKKSFVEFIEESPYCRGSKLCGVDKDGNPTSEGLFYRFNPARDAKVELAEEKIKLQATSHAMEVRGEKLIALAAYCGVYNENDEDIMRNAVYNFARMKPREYNEVADTKSLSTFALLRTCIDMKLIKKRGYAYDIEIDGNTEYLGKNEEDSVAKIELNKGLRESLIDRVEKAR